jgi:hypothetical protein
VEKTDVSLQKPNDRQPLAGFQAIAVMMNPITMIKPKITKIT